MALPGTPYTFRGQGLWDALDGEQAPPGSCFMLQNLIHDETTLGIWKGRPSVQLLTNFAAFSTPSVVSAMLNVGTRIYGLIQTNRNVGNDEPFCFDTATNAFVTISNVKAANTPATQPTAGAWTPPTMDSVGGRIIVTSSGFAGGNTKFGVFDISGFSNNALTGNTNTNTTINSISSNCLLVGYQVGMSISGTNIPNGTYIAAIASDGLSLTLSQAATGSTMGVTLTVAGGTTAAPLWNAVNCNLNDLPAVPTVVKQFNNRAYFVCNNVLYFSDTLNASQMTNATQSLTCGDSGSAIIGIGALGVQQTQGGILAAIMAFKTAYGYWQITGDINATPNSTLVLNGPIGGVGAVSARGIMQVPTGMAFVAVDGVRTIDFFGNVSPAPMQGVRYPFSNALVPSRVCCAYNNTIMRFSMYTKASPLLSAAAYYDYWYDYEPQCWEGPHTFSYDAIVPMGVGFVVASNRLPGALYYSAVDSVMNDTFIELGQPMSASIQSSLFQQDESAVMKRIGSSTWDIQFGSQMQPWTAEIVSATGGVVGQATVTPISPTIWGQFLWGAAKWSGALYGLRTYNLDWSAPVVYKKAGARLTGQLKAGLRVGPARFRTRDLTYTNEQVPE